MADHPPYEDIIYNDNQKINRREIHVDNEPSVNELVLDRSEVRNLP